MAQKRAKELCIEHKQIYDKVIEKIKDVLEKEECYATVWYNDIPGPVRTMLEKDGYKLTYNSYRNEGQYTVSWKE